MLASASVIVTPKNCLVESGQKCSVWNKNQDGYQLKNEGVSVLLQPNAIASILDSDTVELISGNVSVTSRQTTQIESSFATFICERCQAQFYLVNGRLHVKNLEGKLTYKSITNDTFSEFPVGFQTSFYAVNVLTGKAKQEVFSPIDVNSAIDFFTTFTEAKEYIDKIEARETFYATKAGEASLVYKQEAERQIAQEQEKNNLLEQKKAREEKERAALKKLFRQKNYLE